VKSSYRHVGIAKFPVDDNPVSQDLALHKVVNEAVGVYILPQTHAEPRCMTPTSSDKRQASKLKFMITLLMHQFIGTAGVLILATIFTHIAFELPSPLARTLTTHDLNGVLRGSPYFPVQIAVALLLGWLLSDLFGHDSMLWIWVLPYAWLVYDFVRSSTVLGLTFQARFSHFFGWGCRPENHCIDQTGVTLPFYAAVAYSIGALLARKMPLKSDAARRKISVLIFATGVLVLGDEAVSVVFHFDSLIAKVPSGWGWILLPVVVLDAGIGLCLILFALKFRRLHHRVAEHAPFGSG
jgi:hypothetical protein